MKLSSPFSILFWFRWLVFVLIFFLWCDFSTGFDFPDAGSPPTSPRPNPPQQRMSDLSLGSVSDIFGPDSPTSPGRPQSRTSNLSVGSVSDVFSPDSPTRPGPPQSRASNLSVGSASDLFGPDSPTRPGPPKSRWSDLSILSIGSTFSNVSFHVNQHSIGALNLLSTWNYSRNWF